MTTLNYRKLTCYPYSYSHPSFPKNIKSEYYLFNTTPAPRLDLEQFNLSVIWAQLRYLTPYLLITMLKRKNTIPPLLPSLLLIFGAI